MKKVLFILLFFSFCSRAQVNIDFESGNYLNWLGGAYTVPTFGAGCGTSTPNPTDISGFFYTAPNVTTDQHGLCNSGYDPSVTTFSLQIPCPWGNVWSSRLGDVLDSCGAAKMSYSMTIAPNNWDVAISYAVVLFDSHAANDAPKFIYTIKNLTTGQIIDSVYFDSNTISTDTAFHPADMAIPGLYYKNWTKTCYDLTPYLGMNVGFDFITSDCDSGTHRGYAYLDFNINSCSGTSYILTLNSLENSLKVFPNPVSDKLNLTLKNLENDEIEITLLDVQGNILIKESFACAPWQINKTYRTENLPKGMYFVSINTKKQGTIQRKLIIN